jgi:hypothetical protein
MTPIRRETVTITEALAAVMADVQAVAKKDRNEHQKFNFRGIDAVLNAVGPALRKHAVVVVPHVDDVTYDVVQTSTGKPSTACRVVVTYAFHHGDSSLSCRVAAEAWDHGDKAAPKAMSVAFRTALLQALALPTDEPDPDASTYERAAAPAPSPVTNVQAAERDRELADLLIKADGLVEPHEVIAYAGKGPAELEAAKAKLRKLVAEASA